LKKAQNRWRNQKAIGEDFHGFLGNWKAVGEDFLGFLGNWNAIEENRILFEENRGLGEGKS
jgi:hypothetical protein